MLDSNALRAEITRNGLTHKQVAESLGMSANTFSKKLNSGSFGLIDADKMIKLLGIRNPSTIFFSNK